MKTFAICVIVFFSELSFSEEIEKSCFDEAYIYFQSAYYKNLSKKDATKAAKEYCVKVENGDCLRKAFGYFYGYMNSHNYYAVSRNHAFKISESYCSAKKNADCLLNSFAYFYPKYKDGKSNDGIFREVEKICTRDSLKTMQLIDL